MNHDLVKFLLPNDFVVTQGLPTPCELAYGYRHGWIDATDTVQIALAGFSIVPNPPSAYEELALLLSDSLDRVPDLIEAIIEECEPVDDYAQIWLYLALGWVFSHRENYPDPLSIVEQLYADFNYPSEIEGFVKFLPVDDATSTGENALYERLGAYLDGSRSKYMSRFPQS